MISTVLFTSLTILSSLCLLGSIVCVLYVKRIRDDVAEFAADTDVLTLADKVERTAASLKRLYGRFYAALRHDQIDPNAGSADGAEHDIPTPGSPRADALERREKLRSELLPKTMEGRIAAMQRGRGT